MNMLERHIDVLRDFRAGSDSTDQFTAPMRRVGVKKSNPELARDCIDPLQEARKRWPACRIDGLPRTGFLIPEIHSVVGSILADKIEFLYPFLDQMPYFGFDGFHRAASMPSAHLGDDAEAARVIASLSDLHVGKMRRCKPEPRSRVIRDVAGLSRDQIEWSAAG